MKLPPVKDLLEIARGALELVKLLGGTPPKPGPDVSRIPDPPPPRIKKS